MSKQVSYNYDNFSFTLSTSKYDDLLDVHVSIKWPVNDLKYKFIAPSIEWLEMIKDYDETKPVNLSIDDNGGGYSATGTDRITFASGGNSHGEFSMRRADFNLIVKQVDKLLRDLSTAMIEKNSTTTIH